MDMHDLDAKAIGGTVANDSAGSQSECGTDRARSGTKCSTRRLLGLSGAPTLVVNRRFGYQRESHGDDRRTQRLGRLGQHPVGISLAIAAGRDETTALLSRDVSAGGNVEVQSHAGTISNVKGVALASGAEDEGSPAREIANDQLMEVGLNETVGTVDDETTIDSKVSIAAAVGVNLVKSNTQASIDGGDVTATGDVTVQSQNNVDAKTETDGTSVESTSVGIGVGASFNLPIADNRAFIDNSTISANNVTVDASMEDKSGDVIHTFTSEARSGAGARSSWGPARSHGTVPTTRPMRHLRTRP